MQHTHRKIRPALLRVQLEAYKNNTDEDLKLPKKWEYLWVCCQIVQGGEVLTTT